MEIKLWKRALLGSSHLLVLPLNHRLGTEAPSYFSLMFRLTGAHCNWRLLIVNSSLELVSTLNSHGWTMSPTNSCFHLFVCPPVAKIKIFGKTGKWRKMRKWQEQGRRRWNLISWSWLDFSGPDRPCAFCSIGHFMDYGKWIIPDAERWNKWWWINSYIKGAIKEARRRW